MARLGTVLLLLFSACSLSGTPETISDGGAAIDGTFADGGSPPLDRLEMSGFAGCFDGMDNDNDSELDCADSECAGDTVCCVGSADCCVPGTAVTFAIPGTCTDDARISECAELGSDVTPFGDPEPAFEMSGLVPQGGNAWGGLALGAAADPRAANLTVDATIIVPDARCSDCIDAAGVGFIDSTPATGERASVQLGVLVNGGRQELQVMVGDTPVETETLTNGSHTIQITLRIDGTASVVVDTRPIADIRDLRLPDTLQPAVFGRTQNRAGERAVHVTAASVTPQTCDVPSAVSRRSTTILPTSSTAFTPNELGRPSVLTFGSGTEERTRIAFAHDGDILFGGPNGVGELVGTSGPPDTILEPPPGYEALHDPWLTAEDNHVSVYLAGELPDGSRVLMRSSGGPGFGLTFSDAVALEMPEEPGVESMDGPTVFVDVNGVRRMVARVWMSGEPLLVAYAADPTRVNRFYYAHGSLDLSIVHRASPDDVFAIERDEVASPAFVEVDGTWRLYYSARSGARWSIGLLVSREGDAWRQLGEVLGGSNTGFDALGVLHPAPFRTTSGVAFYYVGSDGRGLALGLAGPPGTLGE